MGSAAFLVAAARYLGEALVDAWAREGKIARTLRDDTLPRDADEDPVVVDARRQVIEHCLYGVDINPMAVEMAKLSLWLVSMDPQTPVHVPRRPAGRGRLAARRHVAGADRVPVPRPETGPRVAGGHAAVVGGRARVRSPRRPRRGGG